MKLRSLQLVFAALLFVRGASAITADQLATFFGVSSWQTVVDLPAETYRIAICESKDGVVGEPILSSQPEWTRDPAAGITIMAGPSGDQYRITVTFSSGGTLGVTPKGERFSTTMSGQLPPKIKEGDYVLFGTPTPGGASRRSDDVSAYVKGYVLRIKRG